jgi:hypothetical protein
MITNHSWNRPHSTALSLREGGSDAPEGVAPKQARGWNPFLEWKPERLASPAPLSVNEGPLHPASETVSPYEEAERRRLTRAWNGLQLPL